jgi:hypothetical protein
MPPPFQPNAIFPPMPWPREGVPEFNFNVRSYGGPLLGTDIREFDWSLEVDARSAMITAETFRSDGDYPGHPLGVFRFRAPDEELAAFHKLIVDAKLGQLELKQKTHPGQTQSKYTIWDQGTITQKIVNNADRDATATFRPLINEINKRLGQALTQPQAALKLVLTRVKDPAGERFEVAYTNIGTEKISIVDPRSIAATNYRYAVVRVSPFKEPPKGEPPYFSWTDLPLLPLDPKPKDEPFLIIEPGQAATARTAVWKPGVPGLKHMAYAAWSDFPGQPSYEGTYRVRGRTQSERIEIPG